MALCNKIFCELKCFYSRKKVMDKATHIYKKDKVCSNDLRSLNIFPVCIKNIQSPHPVSSFEGMFFPLQNPNGDDNLIADHYKPSTVIGDLYKILPNIAHNLSRKFANLVV